MLITVKKRAPHSVEKHRSQRESNLHKYPWNPGTSKESCRVSFCKRILTPHGRSPEKAPWNILQRKSQLPGTQRRQRLSVSLRHSQEGRKLLWGRRHNSPNEIRLNSTQHSITPALHWRTHWTKLGIQRKQRRPPGNVSGGWVLPSWPKKQLWFEERSRKQRLNHQLPEHWLMPGCRSS